MPCLARALALAACALALALPAAGATRTADYIVAIVNQELVTAVELQQRITQIRAEARQANRALPPEAALRAQALDSLVEERAIVSHARESTRADDAEIDRAMASVAAQNRMTLPQLRERLRAEGVDYARFRAQVADRLLVERVREREVASRIIVTDAEIDEAIARERGAAAATSREFNLAQLLVSVPEGASEAVVAERRARAQAALARVRGGEDFAKVARELSDDPSKERGGELGLRPADRLPDSFVAAVQGLQPGQVAPNVLRSGAGFHVLKLIEVRDAGAFTVTQTHVRHILLRPADAGGAQAAARQLAEFKRDVLAGTRRFEDLARERSEDSGSAERGGDLGWVAPGALVPEFEEAMAKLPPNGISDPVASRFGIHLIQVLDRRDVALDAKQLREQARAALREQKFERAYEDWVRDLRARAYVELRPGAEDAPQ